jgi:hypothetical protein
MLSLTLSVNAGPLPLGSLDLKLRDKITLPERFRLPKSEEDLIVELKMNDVHFLSGFSDVGKRLLNLAAFVRS